MRLCDILYLSWSNFISTRKKNLLTILSVSVGVMSVVIIASMGAGSSMFLMDEIEAIGIDGLLVSSDKNETDADTVQLLYENIEFISEATPLTFDYGTYRIKNNTNEAVIVGIGKDFAGALNADILFGRFPNEKDIEYFEEVAVVDEEFANTHYKRTNIVGKDVFINIDGTMRSFKIVGVASSKLRALNSLTGVQTPVMIYIPYTSYNAYSVSTGVDQIAVRCNADIDSEYAKKEIEDFLNSGSEKYNVENINYYVDSLKNVVEVVTLFVSGVAMVSLIVAAIGVINIMLSGLQNRKREIGIYMSIGASGFDVSACFLIESVFICVLGASIGILFGILVSHLIKTVLMIPIMINFSYIINVILLSVFGGILTGFIPAIKVSRFDPVELLKE